MPHLKRAYLGIILFFFYAPIGIMIAQSFNASRYRGNWTGFTLEWYESLFESEEILDAFMNTLSIGFLSAAIATVIGLMACLALCGAGKKIRAVFMGTVEIPMLNADIVTGISLMLLFLGLGMRLGYGTILLAHIALNLPYTVLCIMPQLMMLDKSCYEAALDLGASPWVAFRHVVLPELRPGILAGFLLSFTMSADDFIVTHFTKGAGIDTLPTEIYSELKLGVHPEMYALFTLAFIAVLIFVCLLSINRKYMKSALD